MKQKEENPVFKTLAMKGKDVAREITGIQRSGKNTLCVCLLEMMKGGNVYFLRGKQQQSHKFGATDELENAL